MADNYHIPVLAAEVIAGLAINPDGVYADGTLGGGGHARLILERLSPHGRLIGIDRDGDAIAHNADSLSAFADRLTLVRGNFHDIITILGDLGADKPDGILVDLGVSSHQIDSERRGFSYTKPGPLDMRMDTRQSLTAAEVVNTYSEKRIAEILYIYGEEPFSRPIARAIAEARTAAPIETTDALAAIVARAVPKIVAVKAGHPAKKTYMGLRIFVNQEIDGLDGALRDMADVLKPGGRLAVIGFHSAELKIVKNVFRELATDCLCDKHAPICTCGHKATLKIVGKAIAPTPAECQSNPRAASAKLWVAQKI
ncbi:MAG: 16S rRNA (cytosine(1402)-N(4))-methyltransferase RsmH [Clostridiales bacterium]|jgi:16S rRNA (cytosine1402-N4)-methyltransferase|nr:16S rRNA (cytosine(1402)-N(4))-methyltransferase RsmH [Clostridiales bacterium]